MNLKKQATYITSDGTSFTDRKEAVEHEKYLKRKKALEAVTIQADEVAFCPDGYDCKVIELKDLEDVIAQNAEAILAALTIKSTRGRKPKVVAAAAVD